MIDRLPTPSKLVISHKAEEQWNRRRNFVFRTRETKQALDKIHELQQKLHIKDINQTYSPLNTPPLSRKPYISLWKPVLLKARDYSSKQSRDEGNKLIELELLGVSHSFSFFPSVCVPFPFLSINQSLNVPTGRQTAAGQGITDDEEIGRVVCYGVKTLIWWKKRAAPCVWYSVWQSHLVNRMRMRVNSQEAAASAECNNRDARGVVSVGYRNTASGCPPRRQREEGPQQEQQEEAADEPPSSSFFLCLSRTQRKQIRYTIIIDCSEFAVFVFFLLFWTRFQQPRFFLFPCFLFCGAKFSFLPAFYLIFCGCAILENK